uniref:Solute carrier family 25 member 40 n=1 Tax=Cacopsylla melanoneura TaxID=428564 RepID=A0A8D8WPA8_9HEMI
MGLNGERISFNMMLPTRYWTLFMTESPKTLVDNPVTRIRPVQQIAASCTGALITSFIVTPLDVVKIRLQAQHQQLPIGNKCYIYCNGLMDHMCNMCSPEWYSKKQQFTGTLDAFMKISRTEGLTSLWSGLGPTLLLALPATVAYFVTYEQLRVKLKDLFSPGLHDQPVWIPLIAGSVARIGAVTLVSPLELVRTKMQSEKMSYFEMKQALRSLIQYHGVTGLWKGLMPTLLRDVPFSGIYWVTYEQLKADYIRRHQYTKQPSLVHNFLFGSLAGGLAAFVTTPFDIVKTLRQIQVAENEIMRSPPTRSQSTRRILNQLLADKGYRALFTGLAPRLIKVAPSCAIMITSYEMGKRYFVSKNTQTLQELLDKETLEQNEQAARRQDNVEQVDPL